MRADTNFANWKRWILPTILFPIGAIIGMTFLTSVLSSQASFWAKVPSPVQWLLIPGFILLVPAYVFAGGVHGDHVEIVFRLVPLANGLAYALLAMVIRRIFGLRKTKKASSLN